MANIPYLLDPKYEDNPDQKKVIEIDEGFNLVLAPPGCGKTDLLAERVIRAHSIGINYDEMLCLTFTNRAARGMQSRIAERIKEDKDKSKLFVGNVHRFCSSFLFDNHIIPSQTSIIDQYDREDIIRDIINNTHINTFIECEDISNTQHIIQQIKLQHRKDLFLHNQQSICHCNLNDILDKVNLIENNIKKIENLIFLVSNLNRQSKDTKISEKDLEKKISLFIKELNLSNILNKLEINIDTIEIKRHDKYYKCRINIPHNVVEKIYAIKYYLYKKEYNLIDFDDLLIYTYDELLKRKTSLKKYSWIQVDEAQDLNPLQLAIIDELIDQSKKFVVLYLGDEQQAIYSFLGAKLSTLYSLKEKCNNKINRLYKNYRSPKYLLDVFNEYATKELNIDQELLPKSVKSETKDVDSLLLIGTKEEKDQYDEILQIAPIYSQKGERVAIIVNSNNNADSIGNILKDKNINHFKVSGKDLFSEDIVQTIFSHFCILNCENNLIAWAKIFKQLGVFTYSKARKFLKQIEKALISPLDLIKYDKSSYVQEFINLYKDEFIIFDTETTGLDIFNDDIVQIAANKYKGGELIEQFNIYLETNKPIPQYLGEIKNPLFDIYNDKKKYSREEGLYLFLKFIGDIPIIGHNVNYDYNILKYNLKRDCNINNIETLIPICFDSLKLARIVIPNLKNYKLNFLLKELNLKGKNSHIANDDVQATYEVVRFCINSATEKVKQQYNIFNEYAEEITKFKNLYSPLYEHSLSILYKRGETGEAALSQEFSYTYNYLFTREACKKNDKLKYIIKFLDNDIIDRDKFPSLFEQINTYINEIITFKEADLCDSASMQEKIIVSTVHKAKGLEFENVIIVNAVKGIYPYYLNEDNPEMRLEDARKFYVAISRAKRRLIILYYDTFISKNGDEYPKKPSPFLKSIKHFFTEL